MTDQPDDDEAPAANLLPLDQWHRRHGARMVEFAGYVMPIQYQGILAEHAWTRENAGLFDVSHMGQLLVSGAEAAAALDAVLPSDIQALRAGRVRYSLLLNEAGGILDDLMVTNIGTADEPRYYLVVNGATKWDDMAWLHENLPETVTLTHLDEHALLALQGPKAAAVLLKLLPQVVDLAFMQATQAKWQGHMLGISRTGYTGEDGFEISLPAHCAEAFADALLADGAVRPIGLGARDSLRMEAGLPLYGHDMDERTDPVTAGLGFAISRRRRSEGAFIGAAAVLPLLENGTSARRVGLLLDGRMAAREGAAVYAGDARIGTVTSGGFAPSVGAPAAMATIEAGHALPGTALTVELRGKMVSATVAEMPFVPHRYHRKVQPQTQTPPKPSTQETSR
ncbi:glycine cleavage system aminomethyltransferase GcvT [Croceicoccus sp. F390]|uniref:aminomethyltransferase n=1 Tax=Croceicoccus esteveae TaxID=3075597 RepID=A0ABU2ZEI6_9SPHN|nr:glycine cleavage system aminomethyltransferase GcvT [Croceicoccus sp. F390]MDT0575020.1 glycine cleavage system aminomethyltransferase GcvT [Croceicoccus sp. F390]